MDDRALANCQARANLVTALLSQSMADVQRVSGEQAALQQSAAELAARCDGLQADLRRMTGARDELDAAHRISLAEAEAHRSDARSARSELAGALERIDELAGALNRAQDRHEAMEASLSWRVTKPLRWVRALAARA